jgi:hypothetical protein
VGKVCQIQAVAQKYMPQFTKRRKWPKNKWKNSRDDFVLLWCQGEAGVMLFDDRRGD